jgi:haloalkane dehalogenase
VNATDRLRVAHLSEGANTTGETLLLLHGQPTWSYLYRKMIPLLTAPGHRILAPDLIGFGQSDKPTSQDEYTYQAHVDWLTEWLDNALPTGEEVTLVCQDWGGLIGLRMVAANPERFKRVVISNTGLPAGMVPTFLCPSMRSALETSLEPPPSMADVALAFQNNPKEPSKFEVAKMAFGWVPPRDRTLPFLQWVKHASSHPDFSPQDTVDASVGGGDNAKLTKEEFAAYAAPFPNADHIAGARKFPTLVPILSDDVAVPDNKAARAALKDYDRPFLSAFSDSDPVTKGGNLWFEKNVKGAQGVKHVTIEGGGHFVQEEKPKEFSNAILDFINEH